MPSRCTRAERSTRRSSSTSSTTRGRPSTQVRILTWGAWGRDQQWRTLVPHVWLTAAHLVKAAPGPCRRRVAPRSGHRPRYRLSATLSAGSSLTLDLEEGAGWGLGADRMGGRRGLPLGLGLGGPPRWAPSTPADSAWPESPPVAPALPPATSGGHTGSWSGVGMWCSRAAAWCRARIDTRRLTRVHTCVQPYTHM